MSRILAFDYGTKRIGLAISDETKTIATPLPYIPANQKKKLIDLVESQEVEEVIIGLPRSLSGEENKAAIEVRQFAAWLQSKIKLQIRFVDERFTTKEVLREKVERETVDSLVAQKLLQRFLNHKP